MTPRLSDVRFGTTLSYLAATAIASLALSGCASIVDRFSGRGEACDIIAIGTAAQGTITHLIDTGTTINDDPVVEFVVTVQPLDGPVFEAHTKGLVSRLDIPAFQPGRVVPVRFDPANRSRLALDLWDCAQHPGPLHR